METENNLPIEHQNVPVGHQGLHSFLYSSDDEHRAEDVSVTHVLVNNGVEIMPLATWIAAVENLKVAGVYAVLNAERLTQYIGYSRNVKISLNDHVAQNGEQNCAYVRVQTFKFPKRQEMEDLRDAWLAELDSIPSGNAVGASWATTTGEAALSSMSPAERQAYEEKKMKLRKAMADTTLMKDVQEALEKESREQLDAVVPHDDDWSAIINTQTQETKS